MTRMLAAYIATVTAFSVVNFPFLSPASDKRYKKFKLLIAFAILGLIIILIGAGFGVYYLVNWAVS